MIYSKKKMLILVISVIALLGGIYFLFFRVLFRVGDYQKTVLEINGQKINIEIVKSALAEARGLSIKNEIAEDYGMLFIFSDLAIRDFWMKGMKFPIDIIWINGSSVVGFSENVLPQPGVKDSDLTRYYSPTAVSRVLEMKAGSVKRLGIVAGTEIKGL